MALVARFYILGGIIFTRLVYAEQGHRRTTYLRSSLLASPGGSSLHLCVHQGQRISRWEVLGRVEWIPGCSTPRWPSLGDHHGVSLLDRIERLSLSIRVPGGIVTSSARRECSASIIELDRFSLKRGLRDACPCRSYSRSRIGTDESGTAEIGDPDLRPDSVPNHYDFATTGGSNPSTYLQFYLYSTFLFAKTVISDFINVPDVDRNA